MNANHLPPDRELVIALVGNPNSGKSSIFNKLTGSHQHVGNWPGVTVEKKEGSVRIANATVRFVDLPGTYGLSAVSIDEVIARDFLLTEKPDAVIHVIDSSNLSRNLYLTVQLIELGMPLILAMNMTDEVTAKGDRIDYQQLSQLLHAPVVKTVGNRGLGIEELKQTCLQQVAARMPTVRLQYGAPLDAALDSLEQKVTEHCVITEGLNARWLALKLVEGESELLAKLSVQGNCEQFEQEAVVMRAALERKTGLTTDLLVVERRNGVIQGIVRECVQFAPRDRLNLTEKIDNIVLHRALAIPLFLLMIWLTYQFTFTLGKPFMYGADLLLDALAGMVQQRFALTPSPPWLQSLIINGLIGGLGSLLAFLPTIILFFTAIAFLEDSGYMARAAFVMDRLMHKIGLHGKAFIPLIIGFGCNVPAILAARILESRRDRILTIIINPFISCGARMPIWVLLAGAFFSARLAGTVVFGIVMLGVLVAILSAALLSRFMLRGESAPFVMELPPYRLPTLKNLSLRTWERSWLFIRKVATVVLLGVIVMWFLGYFPSGVTPNSKDSYAGRIGHWVEPIMQPLGIDWRGAMSLIFGVVAKEVIVSSLTVLYQPSNQAVALPPKAAKLDVQVALHELFRQGMTPLRAISFMVFTLLYMPCLATIGVMFRELGSSKWGFFALGYGLTLAYVLSFLVYQSGLILGFS